MKPIRWHVVPRDSLAEILVGGDAPATSMGRLTIGAGDIFGDSVAVGIEDARGAKYRPPSILLLKDAESVETLAWLRAYSPDVSPLSQFVRVAWLSDWSTLTNSTQEYDLREGRVNLWASVVVGEAIAQGDAEIELSQLPLSRVSACFSFAMARTVNLHHSDAATRLCADRLRAIESDGRFVKRHVSVSDLLPIWALVRAELSSSLSVTEAVEAVVDTAGRFNSQSLGAALTEVKSMLNDPRGLASDSIEQRVLAFQQVSSALFGSPEIAKQSIGAVFVAAAAFLVGRSTSHEFLLRRVAGAFPTAPIWFGLLAALCGPSAWDSNWTRALKGAERQIRGSFDWTDPSGWDLCWPEFHWYATTFNGDVFSKLQKLTPRALSIEIVPGATCQFRLAGAQVADIDSRGGPDLSLRHRELQAALTQFVSLAAKTRHLLDEQSVRTAPAQQSFLEPPAAVKQYKTKKKREERGS